MLGLLSFLASGSWGQLDLPKKRPVRRPPAGKPAEEPMSGARADEEPGTGAVELPRRVTGDLAPKPEGYLPPALDLPERAAASPEAATDPDATTPLAAAAHDATPRGAAQFVFAELDDVRDLESSLARAAVQSLGALREPGLSVCREKLGSRKAIEIVTAARTLLAYGSPDDRAQVAARLELAIPGAAAQPILDALVERDPVLASPELFVRLLNHRSGAMRAAANRILANRIDASHLPLLAVALRSERAGTREAVIDLAARIEDPAVFHLVASRLGDSNARVARRAAEVLAARDDAEATGLLRELAFGSPPPTRGSAYALLALCMREDSFQEPLFSDADIPALRAALASEVPIVAGASATALASLGFRSPSHEPLPWLDREVPHTLVRLASGVEFHNDFSSLQGLALARLALLSGESLGRNGEAWREWWTEHAVGFRARRAVLHVAPERVPDSDGSGGGGIDELFVRYEPGAGAENLVFLAENARTACAEDETPIYLSDDQALALAQLSSEAGLFGLERLPGRYGAVDPSPRRLELGVGVRSKTFELHPDLVAPWFDDLVAALDALARENRWQRYWSPDEHADQRASWLAERDLWGATVDAGERSRRLAELVLARLSGLPPEERDVELAELEAVYEEPGVPDTADFPRLVALLREELYFSQRARRLARLAQRAVADEEASEGAVLDPAYGRELFEVLALGFGEAASEEALQVLVGAGSEAIRDALEAPEPWLRSLGARALGKRATPENQALLLALMETEVPEVELAAVEALGEARVHGARAALVQRAKDAVAPIRIASLRALARLEPSRDAVSAVEAGAAVPGPGEDGDAGEDAGVGPDPTATDVSHQEESVLNLCVLALAERDESIQLAAVETLAELGDPESASLLATLFARGSESRFFQPARAGLLELGEVAWPDLMRLTHSQARRTSRAAALLLARQGVPEVFSTLLTFLTEDPTDDRVAYELAVLSGLDARTAPDPIVSWWAWWDSVRHDDSRLWLLAAAEREGIAAPPVEALAPPGTEDGALFLAELQEGAPEVLAERARRELERLLERPIGARPESRGERLLWQDGLKERIQERFAP